MARALVFAAIVVFAVGHFRALPRSLGDIDSINFAMAVEDFDVAAHRPHPPGYPVFVALAKGTTAAVRWMAPQWDRDRVASTGIAIIGVVAGSLAAAVFAWYWVSVGFSPLLAALAGLLTASSPLFWFSAGRPLSDTAGLVVAVAAITPIVARWPRRGAVSPMPASWPWAALAAGVALGLRSQTGCVTAPVMATLVVRLALARRWREVRFMTASGIAGVALWLLPLVWIAGGIEPYLMALGGQGLADFRGVEMLATHPSWSVFERAMDLTFVQPWFARPLAFGVLALAAFGCLRLLRVDRRTLALVALSFGPYLVFHLLFHETTTLRYALPLLVPVSGFAVFGLAALGPVVAAGSAVALALSGLVFAAPPLEARATEGVSVARGFRAMIARRAKEPVRPELRLHHQVWWGTYRAMEWYRPLWDLPLPPFPGDREVRSLVDQWRAGLEGPVWFLADVGRMDLEAFDPRTTRVTGHFERRNRVRRLIGGVRLDSFRWVTIEKPTWMLGDGWSLNPEMGGMTTADGATPTSRPAEAFILRDRAPGLRVLVGGRHVGGPRAPAVRLSVSLDGRWLDSWVVDRSRPAFVRWMTLPPASAEGGPYATLTIAAEPAAPGFEALPAGLVSLEQFDAAPDHDVMFAFDRGWFEREADVNRGVSWRWASDSATLDVRSPESDLLVELSGESPLRYFETAPVVRLLAGEREVARFTPSGDFRESLLVPAQAVADSGGRLTVRTDRAFVPAEKDESPDRRRLALRLFRVRVHARWPNGRDQHIVTDAAAQGPADPGSR